MAKPEKIPHRTGRFSRLVARAGRPSVHLTLVDPRKDPALQKLASQGRVLSVHRHRRGEGADYGVVGLLPAPGAQLLVFPKSIKRAAGKRIVGIDFDLLADQPVVTARPAATPKSQPAGKTRRPAPPAKPAPVVPLSEKILPPPTRQEIARELAGIERLLAARRLAPARARLTELSRRIAAAVRG